MEEDFLDQLVDKVNSDSTLQELIPLAPFLSEEKLTNLVINAVEANHLEGCLWLYPFLTKDTLQKIAPFIIKNHGISALTNMAPFL